jgi:hypothetical protein
MPEKAERYICTQQKCNVFGDFYIIGKQQSAARKKKSKTKATV